MGALVLTMLLPFTQPPNTNPFGAVSESCGAYSCTLYQPVSPSPVYTYNVSVPVSSQVILTLVKLPFKFIV